MMAEMLPLNFPSRPKKGVEKISPWRSASLPEMMYSVLSRVMISSLLIIGTWMPVMAF